MLITRQLLRPSLTRNSWLALMLLLGVALCAATAAVLSFLEEGVQPVEAIVYSAKLGGEVAVRREEPYVPVDVYACLGEPSSCVNDWIPSDMIDVFSADSPSGPYGACVLGCVYVFGGTGRWSCVPHVFDLPRGYLP